MPGYAITLGIGTALITNSLDGLEVEFYLTLQRLPLQFANYLQQF